MPNTGRDIVHVQFCELGIHTPPPAVSQSYFRAPQIIISFFFVLVEFCGQQRKPKYEKNRHIFKEKKNDSKGAPPRGFFAVLCVFCRFPHCFARLLSLICIFFQSEKWFHNSILDLPQVDCHVFVFVLCLFAWNRVVNVALSFAGWVIQSYYPPISWQVPLITGCQK